jgi:telomerase reverse transcriptase
MWTGFGEHAKTIATPLQNAVIVDLVRRRPITREACMDLLRTHIKENVWQVGSRLFRQKEGIPQGSKISSLLCSFFYSHLEREHLGWINQPGSVRFPISVSTLYAVADAWSAFIAIHRRLHAHHG